MSKCFASSLVALLLCCSFSSGGISDRQLKRYRQLFEMFEMGVPNPEMSIEIGRAIDGDHGETSMTRLSYWADLMEPLNSDEESVAFEFLSSNVKEVRLIAGLALMSRLNLRKLSLPSSLSPNFLGYETNSDEHMRFVKYIENLLKNKNRKREPQKGRTEPIDTAD